jgi:hypothetical protein
LENIPWASQESNAFKNKIIENPVLTIASMCLDPIKNSYRDHARGTGKRAGSFGDRDDVPNSVDSSAVGMYTYIHMYIYICIYIINIYIYICMSFGDRDDVNSVDSSAVGMAFSHVFSTESMCLRMEIDF